MITKTILRSIRTIGHKAVSYMKKSLEILCAVLVKNGGQKSA